MTIMGLTLEKVRTLYPNACIEEGASLYYGRDVFDPGNIFSCVEKFGFGVDIDKDGTIDVFVADAPIPRAYSVYFPDGNSARNFSESYYLGHLRYRGNKLEREHVWRFTITYPTLGSCSK